MRLFSENLRKVQHHDPLVLPAAEAGRDHRLHVGPDKQIDQLRALCLADKTGDETSHCESTIGTARKRDLRAHRQSGLHVVTVVDTGQNARNLVARHAQNRKQSPVAQKRLQKEFRSGVMGREIGIGEASSPSRFDRTGWQAVQNAKFTMARVRRIQGGGGLAKRCRSKSHGRS